MKPPRPQRIPFSTKHHGLEKQEPYQWMRTQDVPRFLQDTKTLEKPIRAHLEEENLYTEHLLAPTKTLREDLYQEMMARIPPEDISIPRKDGGFSYGHKYVKGGEHPVFYRHDNATRVESILLDGNHEAQGHDFFHIASLGHSPDHRWLLWGSDDQGNERYRLTLRSFPPGGENPKDLPEESVENTTGYGIFDAYSRSFFYVGLDQKQRPHYVFRKEIGKKPICIYEEKDPAFFVSLTQSLTKAYIMICVHKHDTSEVHLIASQHPQMPPALFLPRQEGRNYRLTHDAKRKRFYILYDDHKHPNGVVSTCPENKTETKHWETLFPHQDDVLRLRHIAFKEHLVLLEVKDAHERCLITNLTTNTSITLPTTHDEPYALDIDSGYEYDTKHCFLHQSSLRFPEHIVSVDMTTGASTIKKKKILPSGYDPQCFRSQRLLAPSRDGKSIPISLFYHARVDLSQAPAWLYGYGAYGIRSRTHFSSQILSCVQRGFVYGIIHTRGGRDCGEAWYQDGKLGHKENTFNDFIDATEFLIAKGLCQKGAITAQGGSAGGLLIGAIANRAPSLYRCLIAQVPFVDVLSTMLDASLPLTPPEWTEWGNPITSQEHYKRIAAYSPIDNITAQQYPSILATAGLSDPRVTYWEPARWIAHLRDKAKGGPFALLTHMSGHAGATGRYQQLKEKAQCLAFALQANKRTKTPLLPATAS